MQLFSRCSIPLPTLLILCALALHVGVAAGDPATSEQADGDPADGDLAAVFESAPFTAAPEALLDAAAAFPDSGDDVDVRVLLHEIAYRFADDGSATVNERWIYHFLTTAGAEAWSQTATEWRPWHQEPPRLAARVITADGREHRLDPATISEQPVDNESEEVLSDRRQVIAPLPAARVGAVVEETSEIRDTAPLFAAGVVHRLFLANDVPVERTRVMIDAPADLPLAHAGYLLPDLETHEEPSPEGAGRRQWIFETGPLAAVEDVEYYAPGDAPVWPYLAFSTGESWSAVAHRYAARVDARIAEGDTASVSEIATRIAAQASSRREKSERLLAWLQEEIRYTGLEFGEGALVPRSPAETLARHYGDCKDKATLLAALLRAAGVEAHLALLSTGPGMDVDPELPGMGVFDHAILYLPGGDDGKDEEDLWIDPTDEYAAVGELPLIDQGRLALVAGPGTDALIRTPESRPDDNLTVETREIFLNPDLGGARVVETTQVHGAPGRDLRQLIGDNETADLEEYLDEYMESTYAAPDFIDWSHSDPRDLAIPFELRLEAEASEVAVTDLDQASVGMAPDALLGDLPNLVFEEEDEDAEETDGETLDAAMQDEARITGGRRNDLVLLEPYVAEHRYRVVPPAGYRPVEPPEAEVRQLGPATLTREVSLEGNEVHLTWRFDTVKRRYSPAELEKLRAGVREVDEDEVLILRFENIGQAYLAAGDVGAALREFERLAKLRPESALPRLRRALALNEAGLGEAARRETEAAVELEPELDLVYQSRAWISQHDLFGRLRRPSADMATAVAAYRRAKELEPENTFTRQNLALALAHGQDGALYGPGADLEAAIRELEELAEEYDDHSLADTHLFLLARVGRFEDMLELARSVETEQSAMLELVALAASQSPEAAIREARRGEADSQTQNLISAADQLFNLRRYEAAADLLKAAARGADEPASILAMADTIRRTRPHEELEFDPADPVDQARRFFIAVINGDEEAVSDLLAGTSDDAEAPDLAGTWAQLASIDDQLHGSDMPREALIDLMLSGLEAKTDEDGAGGYRLRLDWSFGGRQHNGNFFVRKEDEEYRVLPHSEASDLGAEAFERLEAGEVEAARTWLDWALDEVVSVAGGDPFATHPFHHFWSRGGDRGADEIRHAAASLMADGSTAERALPVLEAGLAAEPEERRAFELALGRAFRQLERFEDLLELTRGWLDERGDSAFAFIIHLHALFELERWEEVETATARRLALVPDDALALRMPARAAELRGDLETVTATYRRLEELGEMDAGDYNQLAWWAVVLGTVDEETLEDAQQAVLLDRPADSARLHTLATVYAESGRGSEAREILLQAMENDYAGTLNTAEWYVWGRIAESYGVIDAALDAYRRVEEPAEPGWWPSTTWCLAQKRLAGLAASADLSALGWKKKEIREIERPPAVCQTSSL